MSGIDATVAEATAKDLSKLQLEEESAVEEAKILGNHAANNGKDNISPYEEELLLGLYMLMAKERDVNCYISRLSDDSLLHILSFLPSKEAGRSSILSRRWRDVWPGLPCLEFDERDFVSRDRAFRHASPGDVERFLSHVSSALKCHKGTTIRKFRLILINLERPKVLKAVKKWILFALSKNVQELHLDCSADELSVCSNCRQRNHSDDHKSRVCIFDLSLISGRSLRMLSLKDCFVYIPSAIELRHLESLSLTAVYSKQCGFQRLIKHLISGCPLLTNLELQGYEPREDEDNSPIRENIEFSSPHLRSIKFRCCHVLRSIEIDAPALQYFEYEGDHSVDKLNLVSSLYLTKAKVSFCKRSPFYRSTWLTDFISNFIHARFLEVNPSEFDELMISSNRENGQPFLLHELKRVKLVGKVFKLKGRWAYKNKSIRSIISFLGISPKLEHLHICLLPNPKQNIHDPSELDLQELQNNSPVSFPNYLKTVRIDNFAGTESESLLVKYILRRATALEELIVEGSVGMRFCMQLKHEEVIFSWKINPCTKIVYL